MSYSAFVICNCYKNGKTTEPPYKEHIQMDDEEIYLAIPDGLWEKDQELVHKMDRDFDEWKRTACEHEEMRAGYEYLSNISGMSAFRHIVRELGSNDKFSVLTKYLPTSNGGTLPAEFADKALEELIKLENETTREELVLLKEKSTGELKASVSIDTNNIFVFTANNKNSYGIDKDGFFILENVLEKERTVSYITFRSTNFLQRTISKDIYKFIDLPTGESFECSVKLHPNKKDDSSDFEFVVTIEKNIIPKHYAYIIEPLKKLATASIQTGNPIVWL